jgi:hypothetical protein
VNTEPQAGPLFRAAAQVRLTGDHADELRRLLALIAAYQDAGARPSARELTARLATSEPKYAGRFAALILDARLRELCAAGVLEVRRVPNGRNTYTLKLEGVAA